MWSDGRRTLIPLVLNLFLVSKIGHRRRSIVKGNRATDRDLVFDHKESFYCGDDLVDSSEEEESALPALCLPAGDDGNHQEIHSSNEESAADEQPAAETQETYWRDTVSTGCKCRECNHFERMLKSVVIELMTSVQRHPNCELQSHVLGILSVYAMTSNASTTQHRFTYKFLGTVVCKAVFIVADAVSNFVMKNYKRLLNPTVLHASEGVRKAWISVHPDWPTVRKRSNNTSTWGLARMLLGSMKLNKACVRTIQHNTVR